MTVAGRPALPDGLVAVVKRDCETCVAVLPVLEQLAAGPETLTVYVQDDPEFFAAVIRTTTPTCRCRGTTTSTVPTLLRVVDGTEQDRTIGWHRGSWEADRPGGPRSGPARDATGLRLAVDPNLVDELNVRFGGSTLRARRVELADLEDEFEAVFARGRTASPSCRRPSPVSCACSTAPAGTLTMW